MSIIHKNVGIVAAALERAGAMSVLIEYSGSGDSGDISTVTVSWPEEKKPYMTTNDDAIGPIVVHAIESTYINGTWLQTKTTKELTLSDALNDLWERAIQAAGLDGFGDNEGGQGTMTIFSDGVCELSHSYNESNNTTDLVEFNETSTSWTNQQRIATVLRELGAESAIVHYAGYNEDLVPPTVEIKGAQAPWPDVVLLADPQNPDGATLQFPLDEALVYLAEKAIDETGHTGYEDDDGGQGEFTITADGDASLNHVDLYVDSADGSFHTFNVEDGDDNDEMKHDAGDSELDQFSGP